MNTLKKIDPALLVPMDLFVSEFPLRIEVAYATAASFCGPVYRPGARLSLHRDLAEIVLLAALFVNRRNGGGLILYDGLRTVTAQQAMMETDIVKAHPQWTDGETRMLSPPGKGGHPRGMAIDLSIIDSRGVLLDMGTAFDELSDKGSAKEVNRAHREHPGLPRDVLSNRALLADSMVSAARAFGRSLLPLPHEWWDFRFPPEVFNEYIPLSDEDVPPSLRVTDKIPAAQGCPEFPPAHYKALAESVVQAVTDKASGNASPTR